jgi:outer membrane protein assembly factor BamA
MYEFTQNKMLGSLIYEYNERHRLLLDRRMSVKASTENNDDEQEVQNYTITDSVQWVSTLRSLSLNTRYYLGLGGALDREKFHDVNAGTTSLSDERVLGLVAGVDTRRIQWLSEGPSQGQQLRLWAETSNGLNGTYSGNVYRGDLRVYVPVRKTVLALRWNEVYGQADAEPIELGGSDTNESLALPVLNQREFPLRGYSSGEPALTGHRSRLGTIEWRVPLSDVDRHFMVPPVGMNRVSMSLFFDIGAAWDSGESPDYHRGVGIELLSDLRFGYLFGLQLRAGVAWGLDGPGETKGYLRIGRSF